MEIGCHALNKKINFKHTGKMNWKSQGNLSVRKSGNHVSMLSPDMLRSVWL